MATTNRSTRLAQDSASVAADAVTQRLNGGRLRIYADSQQPAAADSAIPGRSTLLVELPFQGIAFEPAKGGVAEAFPMGSARAGATGEAKWYRAVDKAGKSVFDGSVGKEESGADLELVSVAIATGVEILIDRFRYVQPTKATP